MMNKFAIAAAAVTLASASIAVAAPSYGANPTAKKAGFVHIAGCTPCSAAHPCAANPCAANPCASNPCAANPCGAKDAGKEG
jgi:hypothetical protein